MKIIDRKDKSSIPNAAEVLKSGGILVFPTDTVYGIGCILDEKSIKKLYQIKNRSFSKPTAILLNQKTYHILCSSIKCRTVIGKFINKYPKGQVTFVMNADYFKIKFPEVLLKDNKIGIRFPDDKYLEKLIDQVGPIVASSANIAGESTPKNFAEISDQLLSHADLVIKSDRVSSAPPSTVYDLESGTIIRE